MIFTIFMRCFAVSTITILFNTKYCIHCCNRNIISFALKCKYFDHPPRVLKTVPDDFGGSLSARDSSIMFSKADALEEISSALIRYEWNVPTVVLVFSVCPNPGSLMPSMIIERTKRLVLGPCTALYRPFLKHCTLTNQVVETIWRALFKPPQRRQGPDLRPLRLLGGTPSAIRPELAFSRAEHSLPFSYVTIYICYTFVIYLSSMLYVYRFYDLLACGGCLFAVYIRRFIYKF